MVMIYKKVTQGPIQLNVGKKDKAMQWAEKKRFKMKPWTRK
jgi:hypothetical protein